MPADLRPKIQMISSSSIEELKIYYEERMTSENEIGGRIVSYINEGAGINTHNVDEVIARMKEKITSR